MASALANEAGLLARAAAEIERPATNFAKVTSMLRSINKQLAALSPEQMSDPQAASELVAMRTTAERLSTDPQHRDTQVLLQELGEQLERLDASRVEAELRSLTPSTRLDQMTAHVPDRQKMWTMLARMYPGAEVAGGINQLVSELKADLAHGGVLEQMSATMKKRGVAQQDSDAFFRSFAEVRHGFEVGARSEDLQRTNWIHTRIEVLHTLEAADDLDLSADETLAALLGSLASDSFKESSLHGLLWHNRGGAELVLPLVASRHFDLSQPRLSKVLDQAMRIAHEHQITPPLFMAGAIGAVLKAEPEVVEEIKTKIDDPLSQAQQDGEILFSDPAREAMERAGIPGWAVPTKGTEHYLGSLATMFGDVMQYPGFDGVLKYAVDIRDPASPSAIYRDPNIKGAVMSSVGFSFGQGMKVIEDEHLQALGRAAQEKMVSVLDEQVYTEVERRLRSALGVAPGEPTPAIPYWNTDVSIEGDLTDDQTTSVKLVKKTMEAVLAELGNVPLQPFAKEGRAND